MADYNVNMKQWNGSSFDNVLPLAYNAKQLEGSSLSELKTWVQDNGLLLYTGQYTGTGTYGSSNLTVLTFPFEPILIFTPRIYSEPTTVIPYFSLTSGTTVDMYMNGFSQNNPLKITASNDRKSLSYYNTTAEYQFNYSGTAYYFAAIGGYDVGGQTEWTITSSGTWTVPRTGRYYIELYGGGGGITNYGATADGKRAASGGSSCQSYSSVNLTANDSIAVSIGVGGTSDYGPIPTRTSTGTSFGTYSVAAGGMAAGAIYPTAGTGAGNLGTNGSTGSYGDVGYNYSNGTLKIRYGYGGYGGVGSYTSSGENGGSGAVYIKYLGA